MASQERGAAAASPRPQSYVTRRSPSPVLAFFAFFLSALRPALRFWWALPAMLLAYAAIGVCWCCTSCTRRSRYQGAAEGAAEANYIAANYATVFESYVRLCRQASSLRATGSRLGALQDVKYDVYVGCQTSYIKMCQANHTSVVSH